MKYTFVRKDDFFIREDKEISAVIIRQTAEQFLLNSTGVKIFKYLLDNNDTDIVLELMLEEYGKVNKEVINKDILNIVNLLKIYNIIKADGLKEQKEDKIYKVAAIDEDMYAEAGHFIEKNRSKMFLISGVKGYYVPQNIRSRIMSNQEYYYGITEDNEYKCIAVINPNLNNTSVINLSTLVFDNKINLDVMVDKGKEIIEYIIKNMFCKVNKVRFSYYSNNDEEPEFLDVLKNIGFEKEANLKKEYKDFDMHIYVIYLKEN